MERRWKMEETYSLQAIGKVHASSEGFMIEVFEPYRAALDGLGQFSHALVLWWADRNDNPEARAVLEVDLPYAKGKGAGVFACRSERRPNPIAVTTCALIHVDEKAGQIIVPWMDALDGTPVIDLKPFIPASDRVRDFHVAPWMSDWPEWMEDSAQYFEEHAVDFGD